jgi:hypothetical protein
MSTPDSELHEHLQALFGGLDAGTDFDARLMARLRVESHEDATERVARARQQERERYRRAVLELQSRRRSTLRLLTLDTLGIALVLAAIVAAWPHFSRDFMSIWHQYGAYIATLLAVLIAAVPPLGMWTEQTRRPIRPL